MAPSKIVVVGDVNGQIEAVFHKLGALHAKNAFSFALIAGNLFADPDSATNEDVEFVSRLIEGKFKVPLPTYFSLGTHALPTKVTFKLDSSEGELCSNLYFLGKRTTTKTSEAIKIVSLGGSFDPNLSGVSKDAYSPLYSEADARSLKGANKANIMVTSEWPEGIRRGSKVEFDSSKQPKSNRALAELCTTLKPRYHFSSSSGHFYEREPFFHTSGEEKSDAFEITRFISLAPFNNPDKQKWIYAFSLDPTAAPPVELPAGTTASPLATQGQKRGALPDQNSYRFSADHSYKGESRSRKRQKQAPPGPSECFFCLSNPSIATHLITSIGNDSYLTTAKGPLSTESTYPSLDFPAHILIIPLTHSPTLALIPGAESRDSTYKEMNLFRSALNSMVKNQSSDLGSVTWEVSRGEGIHIHWQYLPIPVSLIRRSLVEAAFRVEAENDKYPKVESRVVSETETDDYFRALVWDPETGKDRSLVLPLDSSFRFDLQFGRRVLAKLLRLEGRVHWQDCGQMQEDEERDVARFKEAFKEFDFTLDE